MPMVFLRHARWIDKNPRHLVIVPVKTKRTGRHHATELSCGPSGEIVPGAFRSGECRGISNFLFLICGGVGYGNTVQSRLWRMAYKIRELVPSTLLPCTILICQSPSWVGIQCPPPFLCQDIAYCTWAVRTVSYPWLAQFTRRLHEVSPFPAPFG